MTGEFEPLYKDLFSRLALATSPEELLDALAHMVAGLPGIQRATPAPSSDAACRPGALG